ncbi:MAG: hotdog fold thioesterase [Myxococcota bacterium]
MTNIEALRSLSPFNNWMKLQMEALEPGFAKIRLPWSDSLIGDPTVPRIHGGILASLIDATGGAACMSKLGPEDSISTIDLQVNYIEPGSPGDFVCDAHVVRVGGRIGVARMEVYSLGSNNEPKLVTVGTGTYNLIRR